jgi:hypothetical protein
LPVDGPTKKKGVEADILEMPVTRPKEEADATFRQTA